MINHGKKENHVTKVNEDFLIVLDFDGVVKLLPHEGNSTWSRIDNRILNEETKKPPQFNRRFFLSRKANGGLSDEAQAIWFGLSLQAWIEGGLTRQDIVDTFAVNDSHVRSGFSEFLHWLKQPRNGTNIRIAINSYGFVQMIEEVLKNMGVRDLIDKICATELLFDDQGVVTGHVKDTFIGVTEKGIATKQMMDEWGILPSRTVGIGDSDGDRFIAPEHRLLLVFNEGQIGNNEELFTDVMISPDWSGPQQWLEEKFSL